ncbi:MAG: hypothetical protein IH991_25765 [Planctomycetes bacterium]|nr:hypothetical protein [Planctomycetota bacterium]
MRKLIIMSFAVAVVAILSSSQRMADEKASTSELPAALQAMGVDHANMLTMCAERVIDSDASDASEASVTFA